MNSEISSVVHWLAMISMTLVLPPLLLGFIRKTKAHLQRRTGAPVYQVILDLIKLLRKGELVSETAS
ncbi:MAG: NADH-quinone oxidoreductase subunit H, partial [Cyanobacteria bacterium]|nr:NADH-quinone oxidoreductase subunit H [Cyanobacteriota bacterium]